jgi:hypothetical protein
MLNGGHEGRNGNGVTKTFGNPVGPRLCRGSSPAKPGANGNREGPYKVRSCHGQRISPWTGLIRRPMFCGLSNLQIVRCF